MARIDDWQNVVPEGKALRKECQLFQGIIAGVVDKPYLPISGILNDVSATMKATNDDIVDFLNKDKRKDRSAFNKAGWKVNRVYLAWDYRAKFKATTEYLEVNKKKIEDTLALSAVVNKPTAHWYKGDMANEESFAFWREICGEELHAPNWSIFTETYQQRYNVTWDSDMLERVRRVACRDGDHLTISGYIILTKLCDFPLKVEKLPLLIDSHATVSAQTRMEIAKMVNELITYYSTKEMRDLLVAIFTWYKGCNKRERNGEAWQERANEWAREIIKNRGKSIDELDERGKLAEQVDMARRTYSFFFQRYMVVFTIGQLSKEMFSQVDFPGKARMFEFIDHVKPLDHANYHIVIRGDPTVWESKQPKVYKFLSDYIASEKRAKKEAAEAAEAAAKAKAITLGQTNEELDDIVNATAVGTRNTTHDTKTQVSSNGI
ncbi:unnamed protein product [Absidia cylindrospora]